MIVEAIVIINVIFALIFGYHGIKILKLGTKYKKYAIIQFIMVFISLVMAYLFSRIKL